MKQKANQIVALINMLNIIYSAKSSEGVFSSLIKNVDNFVIMVKKINVILVKKKINNSVKSRI